ncbi:hypothetical protein N0V93_005425 [Gnomoniopsis smithogilvyi]|uniref:Sur7 protein n=1 Tax=Gnomoniopsis smithogilvyi TaxID=1191159 RepID=A0A9W9CY12_9PEZI|nr:hypothetical protein N0V93_005425 [Gnomoniopsis smithogilvyi]
MRLRLTAAGAAVASIVTFALAVVLLAAGSSPSSANDDYWIALNTSDVGANLVTIEPSTSSSDPLGSIISSIPGLEPILNNITQEIGDGLSDVQGQIVGALVSSLGLRDFYLLYASKMCEGDLNSNGGIKVDKCYSFHDGGQGLMNISNSIPSSFTIANTQVAVPAVSSLQGSLKSIVNQAVAVSTALMVLLIITSIASGLTAVGSVLGILRPMARLLLILNFSLSAIAATSISILAIALTGIVPATTNMINSFGSGLSLKVKPGVPFLVILWVATVLAFVANAYWFIVWFVQFRRTALSRRSRTKHQIGNWRGILGEVRKDIKTDGHFPPPEEHGEHGSNVRRRSEQQDKV